MALDLAVDEKLIEEAMKVGHHKTPKKAVTCALVEYIQRRNQLKILDLFGKIEFVEKYNYKTQRDMR